MLRSSLNLVDHAVASALGRVRAHAEPAVARFGPRWLVASSGGADSLVLLVTLVLLRRRLDLTLYAAHVDHGLRVGSADEGEVVRRIAAALEVPFFALQVSLDPGAGVAARARELRHAALDHCAEEVGAGVVALGHTATDRAETLLLNLARGSGLGGLSAMPALDARRVRPLLDFSRAEVRALAERMRLPFVDDPTNDREDLPRTAVRHRILPVLDALHAGVDRRIAATAAELADVKDALDEWVGRELEARVIEARVPVESRDVETADSGDRLETDASRRPPHAPGVTMTLADWARLPKAVRIRTVRTFLLMARVDGASLGRDVVESIDAACLESRGVAGAAGSPGQRGIDGGRAHLEAASTSPAVRECVEGASWSVRPHLRVCVRQGTLSVEAAGTAGPPSESTPESGPSESDPSESGPRGSGPR